MVAPRASSIYDDTLQIYLPSNSGTQAFIPPSNTYTYLTCQFLPVFGLNTDNDYSVGMYARGEIQNSGGIFKYLIHLRYGGLISGQNYLLQIN